MIRRTNVEILDAFNDIWKDADDIIVTLNTDDAVRVKLSSMYESPGLTFAQLQKVALFFDTDNINDDARFSSGGCETCDYGSTYGFELTMRPRSGT